MASRIDFSGIGRNALTGLNSRLNHQEIIDKRMEVLQQPIDGLDTQISLNNDKIQAYTELKGIIQSLYNTTDKLRYVPGNNNQVFDSRVAYSNSNTGVAAGVYLGVNVNNGAEIGHFDLEVKQLAQSMVRQTVAFSSKTSSIVQAANNNSNSLLFTAGTFQLNGINITLSEGSTLQEVIATINHAAKQTGVGASIFEPTSGQFRMILQSKQTGVVNVYTIEDPDNVWNQVLSYDAVYNPYCDLQTAQDCIVTYNGLQDIQRPTNTIDDCLENIVISVYQVTPQYTKISTDITWNQASVIETMQQLVTAYNTLLKFTVKQQQRNDMGEYLDGAKIRDSVSLDGFLSAVQLHLPIAINGQSQYMSLFDVGFSFEDIPEDLVNKEPRYNNLLRLDSQILIQAMEDNFEEVRHLFEFNLSTASAKLLPTRSRSNNLPNNVSDIVITIDIDIDQVVQLSYKLNDVAASALMQLQYFDSENPDQGGTIRGLPGTILEGFSFLYTGTGHDTLILDITQGIADRIYNSLSILQSEGGAIDIIQQALRNENERSKDEKLFKTAVLEEERNSMLNRFASLEAYISNANTRLTFIEAMNRNKGN